jgi:hypothetical protein
LGEEFEEKVLGNVMMDPYEWSTVLQLLCIPGWLFTVWMMGMFRLATNRRG